jgi:archaellum component FlaG (FlaF/FlaG flagellin family)
MKTQSMCSAHISVNRNRVKNYNKTDSHSSVFLKDGQNFEIELYNSKQNSVLAKISINGNSISSSGIILRPGQRVYIERFIDTPNKFEFSTYEVDDTSANRKAIANNGEVEVKFYDEYIPTYNYYGGTTTWTNHTYPFYIHSTGNVGIGCTNPSTTLNITGTTTGTTNYSNLNSTFTANVAGSLETGRIEKGKSSDQHFSTTNGSFNSYEFFTERIKLLPNSMKPVETSEIRNYCTNCGTRAKKAGWKFCPSCGGKF